MTLAHPDSTMAASGEAVTVALQADARRPDYVLCDFAMPGLNGQEPLTRSLASVLVRRSP